MKNLKIFSTLITILFFGSCFAQRVEIAKKNADGKTEFTAGLEKVKGGFAKVLETQKIEAVLTNFEIKNEKDPAGKSYFHIIASNSSRTVNVAHRLYLTNSIFAFDFADGTTTCSGCPSGCNPKLGADGYYFCTPCSIGEGCAKSTTVPTNYP